MKKLNGVWKILVLLVIIIMMAIISINLGYEYNMYVGKPKTIAQKKETITELIVQVRQNKDINDLSRYIKDMSTQNLLNIKDVIKVEKNYIETLNVSTSGEYTLIVGKTISKVQKDNVIVLEIDEEFDIKLVTDYFIMRLIIFSIFIILTIIFIVKIMFQY